MTSNAVQRSSFIPELESIRGLMAWWVVLGHFYSYFCSNLGLPGFITKLLTATAIPVDIFICLSGFVIGASLILNPGQSYRTYLLRRAFRILPIYFLAIILAILFFEQRMGVKSLAPWFTAAQAEGYADYAISINERFGEYLLACLTLTQGIVPDQWLPFSGIAFLTPAWSLSLEWQFYLLAPFIVAFASRSPRNALIAFFLSSVLILQIKTSGFTFSYGGFLPMKLPFFLLGIVSAKIVFSSDEGRGEALKYIGIFFLLIPLEIIYREKNASITSTLIWVIGAALVLYGDRCHLSKKLLAILSRRLSAKFMMLMGKISYPTYLIHVLIIDAIGYGFFNLGVLEGSPGLRAIFAGLILLPVTFAISYMLHRTVEIPFIHMGKRMTGRASI